MEHYHEINEALSTLARLADEQENLFIENEGEVTPETEALEAQKEALKALLSGDGIDILGRWLKSKEDEKDTYKAEKAAIDRRLKSVQNTIDFIKAKITEVLAMIGKEKAKGLMYAFTRSKSVTTKVDTEELERLYLDIATAAAREAGLPEYVTLKLDAKVSLVPEGDDLPDVFVVNEKDTVRFTKPRKTKED
jgi:hypothetical protein